MGKKTKNDLLSELHNIVFSKGSEKDKQTAALWFRSPSRVNREAIEAMIKRIKK